MPEWLVTVDETFTGARTVRYHVTADTEEEAREIVLEGGEGRDETTEGYEETEKMDVRKVERLP